MRTIPGFAYLGCIVAFVHACALAGGMLLNWFTGRAAAEGGVNMAGFLVGSVLGIVLVPCSAESLPRMTSCIGLR
jgi:hypothetical protein